MSSTDKVCKFGLKEIPFNGHGADSGTYDFIGTTVFDELIEFITDGGNAWCWLAKNSKGEKVFLKHYKSPTVSSGKTIAGGKPWFDDYYKYEREKNRRIEDSAAKDFCISTLDIFKVGYPRSSSKENMFQVYKYEEVGGDLRKILEKIKLISLSEIP